MPAPSCRGVRLAESYSKMTGVAPRRRNCLRNPGRGSGGLDGCRPPGPTKAASEVSRWWCPPTYVQEQVLIFEIDQLPWPMESGVR